MFDMKAYRLTQALRSSLSVLGSVALLTAANAEEPSKWKIGGNLDLYYQYGFNRPGTGTDLSGRQYDIRHNSFSLAALQLNISGNPVANSKVGLTVQLIAGRNGEINNLAEPGGKERYKYIHQAYLSYPLTDSGWTIDLGKFLTPIGYEVATSGDNDQYGRSFLFTLAQPLYHTGLRVSGPIGKGATATAAVVNGWNEVENSNGQLSYALGVSFTPNPKTLIALNGYFGTEGGPTSGGGIAFPTNGKRNVALGDLVATYQATDKLKIGLNADVASARRIGPSTKGEWRGVAGYAKYQFTDKFSLAARYETFSDEDGLRTGADARLNSSTLTAEYKLDSATQIRLEYRADRSNSRLFPSDEGAKKKQDSVSLSVFFKF